jgi:hypothetical protein
LVEVVRMVVAEEDGVDVGHFVEVYCWVGYAGCGHAWAEMHVIACVEEVGVCEDADAFPFSGVMLECTVHQEGRGV